MKEQMSLRADDEKEQMVREPKGAQMCWVVKTEK
jgi:hypothetical protein